MNNTIFFFIKGLVLFFLFHLIFSSCHSVNGYRIPSEHIIPDTIIAREKLEQARLLMDSALYNQAIEQTEKALAIYRKTVGEIDTLTAAGYILESDIYLEIFNYNKALKIAKKAKDICTKEVGEVHFLTAKSNFNIGYAKERLGDKEEGLKHYEKALKLLPANKEEKLFIGKVYRRVGIIYRNSNEFDLATKYFNQAINLYLNNSEENHPDLANTYVSIGLAHDRKFEFEKAISKFQKAQQIFSRIYSPNHPNMAKLYRNIGTVKAKQGLYNEARENYEKALEAYKKYFGGEHVLVGGIYHNLGVVCNKKADYNRALLYFKHSLEIKQGRKDASIYTTYNGIGNAMQLAGRYDEALLHFQMALNEYKSIYGNKGEGLGIIYDNIGIVYERKGDYDNAYRYFQQALNIKRHELGERNPKTAETYFSLGSLSRKIGELDSALLFYNKALEINRLELGEKHQKVANVYNDIGIVYRQQKAYNEALIMFQKAKTIFSDTFGDKHPNVASTLQNIGLVYKDIEEFDVAVSYLRKAGQALRYRSNAPKEFSNVTNLNRLQSIFHSLTELYSDQLKRTKQQGYQDNLNECYNNWLALEEYIQLEYTNPDTRQYYTSTSLPVYDDAINAAYKSNNSQKFQQAFVLSEKTKSRQLAEKIQAESYRSSLGLPDSLSQNEYNLNIDIAYYEKSKLQEKNKNTSINDSLIQVYQNKIFDLRQQRMELLNIFKEKYPTYFKARYSVDVISVEQVQQNLNTQQTLLEYFVGDSTIYLFLIQQNNYEVSSLSQKTSLSIPL
jgi:tetratricopeptide (TPR) repeat protein